MSDDLCFGGRRCMCRGAPDLQTPIVPSDRRGRQSLRTCLRCKLDPALTCWGWRKPSGTAGFVTWYRPRLRSSADSTISKRAKMARTKLRFRSGSRQHGPAGTNCRSRPERKWRTRSARISATSEFTPTQRPKRSPEISALALLPPARTCSLAETSTTWSQRPAASCSLTS